MQSDSPRCLQGFFIADRAFFQMDSDNGLYHPTAYYCAATSAGRLPAHLACKCWVVTQLRQPVPRPGACQAGWSRSAARACSSHDSVLFCLAQGSKCT